MTQSLSPHFTLEELTASDNAARYGIDNSASPKIVRNLTRLAATLEQVRALVGVPLSVSSGYRCMELNRRIGSADTSAHVLGLAADIRAAGLTPRALAEAIAASPIRFDQCILEFPASGGWVHVGLRSESERDPERRQLLTAVATPGRTLYKPGLV